MLCSAVETLGAHNLRSAHICLSGTFISSPTQRLWVKGWRIHSLAIFWLPSAVQNGESLADELMNRLCVWIKAASWIHPRFDGVSLCCHCKTVQAVLGCLHCCKHVPKKSADENPCVGHILALYKWTRSSAHNGCDVPLPWFREQSLENINPPPVDNGEHDPPPPTPLVENRNVETLSKTMEHTYASQPTASNHQSAINVAQKNQQTAHTKRSHLWRNACLERHCLTAAGKFPAVYSQVQQIFQMLTSI